MFFKYIDRKPTKPAKANLVRVGLVEYKNTSKRRSY